MSRKHFKFDFNYGRKDYGEYPIWGFATVWPNSFLTNFKKEAESNYSRAIKESGFGDILEIKTLACDCNGVVDPDSLSLHYKEGIERQDLSKFWAVFKKIG